MRERSGHEGDVVKFHLAIEISISSCKRERKKREGREREEDGLVF